MEPSSGRDEKERAKTNDPSDLELWLVNDDPAQLLVQKRLLGRFASTVYDFSSAVEALAHVEGRTSPSHLVTDFRMPQMNGLELARIWCELHPDSRILLLSSSPLNSTESAQVAELPSDRVWLLSSYRIPELVKIAQEWFQDGPADKDSVITDQDSSTADAGPADADPSPIAPTDALYRTPPVHFDLETHRKLSVLGGKKFLIAALERFSERLTTRLEGCLEAVDGDDANKLFENAHALKGSCGVVGANALFELVDKLEEAARNEATSARLRSLVDEVAELTTEVSQELVRLRSELVGYEPS